MEPQHQLKKIMETLPTFPSSTCEYFPQFFFEKQKLQRSSPQRPLFSLCPAAFFWFLIAISNKKQLQDFEQKEKDGTFFFEREAGRETGGFPFKVEG